MALDSVARTVCPSPILYKTIVKGGTFCRSESVGLTRQITQANVSIAAGSSDVKANPFGHARWAA